MLSTLLKRKVPLLALSLLMKKDTPKVFWVTIAFTFLFSPAARSLELTDKTKTHQKALK